MEEAVSDFQLYAAPEDNADGMALARQQITSLDPRDWTASYEKRDDAVYIRKKGHDALAISYFGVKEPLILFNLDASTGELVGVDIQHFKRHFLKKHPEGRQLFFPRRWPRRRNQGSAESSVTQQIKWSVQSAGPRLGIA